MDMLSNNGLWKIVSQAGSVSRNDYVLAVLVHIITFIPTAKIKLYLKNNVVIVYKKTYSLVKNYN